ncbi:MAG: ArnT family glycosyltransferase [Anaerolineae bacterium]
MAIGLVLLMVVGAALRLAPIGANRFHQDEALYSFWALQIVTGRDPILIHSPVDKPPLFIYTLALCFKLFGPSEVAARLPSELASAASIALLYYLARRLYGRAVAVLAAILMAFSPFNIPFAPTAFTDPLMVAWVLAALCLAVNGSLGWSGLALGLAAATKQQGLLFVPLAVVIATRRLTPSPLPLRSPTPPLLRTLSREGLFLALGFLTVMAPVAWWDSLRWRLQPNYFEQSLISYGGLALVDPAQLVERLGDWAEILHYITASPFLNILLLVGLPCLLLYNLGWRRGEPATFFDVVLSAFVVLFLLGHWLLSFNVWDRYLLGLVPILLILLARVLWLASGALAHLLSPQRSLLRVSLIAILLAATLAGPALEAARSRYPIGGDHGAYDGIEAVADYFRDSVPAGSILYHHWLGWHYSFYLFDFPLVLRWYPSPEELAQDARQVDDAQLYVVFPSGKLTAEVRDALAEAGLTLRRVYRAYRRGGSTSFTVYWIENQK